MWSIFRSRERFSLEELKHLNDQLHKYPVITDANKDTVVETLRSIAELMIWGDQHDQQYFEFFMDNKVLAHFFRILTSDESSSGGVAVQLLQTLNIMIQNLRSETAIYYMFSKEYINNVIGYRFDFKDEELLAYYISFLRTISMKLDTTTVSCFIIQDDEGERFFPLYTEAIKFFHHEEGMVRIAVRTLTLNVYNVKHEEVRKFVLSEGPVRYFEDLATFVRQQSFKLDSLVNDAATTHGAPTTVGRLEASIAELGDLLYYCNDVMTAGIPELGAIMARHLREILVQPVLLESLVPVEGMSPKSAGRLSPLTAMYLLSRLLHITTYKPLLESIIADALTSSRPTKPPDIDDAKNRDNPAGAAGSGREAEWEVTPCDRRGQGDGSEEMSGSMTRSGSGRGSGRSNGGSEAQREEGNEGEREGQAEGKSKQNSLETSGSGRDGEGGWGLGQVGKGWWGRKVVNDSTADRHQKGESDPLVLELDPTSSAWEMMLSYLLCDNERWVMAALCILVALLQNKDVDDVFLDVLGILPQRKRHKKLLLQALVSSKSDEELSELLSLPPDEADDDFEQRHGVSVADLGELKRLHLEETSEDGLPAVRRVAESMDGRLEDENTCTCGATEGVRQNGLQGPAPNGTSVKGRCTCAKAGSRAVDMARNRRQVLDALMVLMCRRPPPCAEALWHVGWLLRQLLPYHEHKLSAARLKLLNTAYAAAREDLAAELVDCWCDLLPLAIADEWKTCKKALETPSLQKDSSFVLMPSSPPLLAEGDTSSAALGERMRTTVKVFVALHQMRTLLLEGPVPDAPPLGQAQPPSPSSRSNRKGVALATVQEGQEIPLTAGDAMPCRVAFERGKERAVLLSVASMGAPGFLLLTEALPSLAEGVVRVVAPLAGSRPTVDKRHSKWLHLRIRSPQLPSADAGTLGSSSPMGSRTRTKRLADGRWTLAFADDQRSKAAQQAVLEEIYIQSNAVRQILEPMLGPIEPFRLEKSKSEAPAGG